jgi:prepilin-type N-terminal cleavage/methylation domain-containing protein
MHDPTHRAVPTRRARRRQGFSLVEMTAVIAVTAFALLATLSAAVSGARLARTTSELRAATRSAESLVESIRSTPYAEIASKYAGRSFPMSASGGADSTGDCAVAVTQVDTGSTEWPVLEVKIVATWKGASGASSQSFVTYVADRSNGATL